MATCKNLEFTINSRVVVSDETADRCLRLLEIWMDDNPDKQIIVERSDGRHRAHIERIMAAEPEAKEDEQEIFPEWDVIPVQDIPSYTEMIFLEDYPQQLIGVRYKYTNEKTETMVFKAAPRNGNETDGLTIYRHIEDYGHLWRCWDKPMTVEEREAVKWK